MEKPIFLLIYSILSDSERSLLTKFCQELKFSSLSSENGLDYLAKVNPLSQELVTQEKEIVLSYNRKFLRSLGKKNLLNLLFLTMSVEELQNEYYALLGILIENEKVWNLQYDIIGTMMLHSKTDNFLIFQQKHSKSKHFFTNLLKNKVRVQYKKKLLNLSLYEILLKLDLHYILIQKTKPVRVERHRGYRDHGSLGDKNIKAIQQEEGKEFLFRNLQIEKEQKLQETKDLADLTRGFLS